MLKIDGAANERLGAASGTNAKITSRPVAVWDENDTTAWIFAGAPNASTNVGKLYIYKISYAANGTATSTQITTPLAPPMTEYTNRVVAADVPYYGRAVSISADGQTLAVSAPDMNSVGAVYVYTKPAGGWNSLTYNDGIKVTPAQIPAWGTIGDATTRPFDQTSTNTGDAYNQCDSYCSKVNANTDSLFGWSIELSGDGSTLAVGATEKDYPDSTAGGSFTSGPTDAGAVLIFNAPTGGWSAAADATTGKTVIAAQATAAAWDPANNYSPGPAKRVESADAELIPAAWTSRTNTSYFGTLTNISADGSTVVAFASLTSDASLAHIFTQPADGWANATAATGTIRLGASGTASAEGLWGVDVNADGSRVLIEDRDADMTDPTATDAGAVYRFDRPTAGWTGTLARTDNTGGDYGADAPGQRTLLRPALQQRRHPGRLRRHRLRRRYDSQAQAVHAARKLHGADGERGDDDDLLAAAGQHGGDGAAGHAGRAVHDFGARWECASGTGRSRRTCAPRCRPTWARSTSWPA